jgi:hypothetical protein
MNEEQLPAAPLSDDAAAGARKARAGTRLRARARVECRVGMTGMSSNIATGLVNVSAGGAMIATRAPVELQRAVELRFWGPEERTSFIVLGKVVRCDPAPAGAGHHLGVKFDAPLSGPNLYKLVHTGNIVEG